VKLWFAGFGWHQFRRIQITLKLDANYTFLSRVWADRHLWKRRREPGHSRVDTTMAYTLIDANRDEEQVTRLYNWLMGPVEGPKQ
jgi:hypothetical protein